MSLLKFKALADETRLRLAHILLHYELSVNELVQIMGMGQSRISRHLKILLEAGLLSSRRDGLWVFYSAPSSGQGREFLLALQPFFANLPGSRDDLLSGAEILEERATRARQFFNRMAASWDDLNREVLGSFNLQDHVLQAVPANCQVAVDLGCGTGAVLASLRDAASTLIGVDGSAAMLNECRQRLADSGGIHASLRIGELSHLPLADHEANFACLNLVLHHLPVPAEAFREIRRILAHDGILFLTDFQRHTDESMRQRYGDHWLGFELYELEQYLAASGFRLLRTQTQPVGHNLSLLMLTCQTN